MINLVIRFAVSLVIISGLLYVLPGIKTTKFYCAVIAATIITAMNMLLSNLLVYFSYPFTGLCFGLFIVVLDAVILYALGAILKRIRVDGFGWAFVFGVMLSLVIYVVELVFRPGYFEVV